MNINENVSSMTSRTSPLYSILTLLLPLLLRVHDVRAADWVADQSEESHGEAEKDCGQGGVAAPHLEQARLQLVVGTV